MNALQPITRPAWREQFTTGATYVEAKQMHEQLRDGVGRWPRELAKPIIKRFNDAFAKMPQPVSGGVGLQPLREVLAWADAIKRELATLQLEMVSGDAELCELAERCARMCEQYPDAAEFIVRRIGIDPPIAHWLVKSGSQITDTGKLLRMQCVRWWRRSLRRHFGQAVENAMRSRGYVRKGKAAYCTDWALRRRASQKQRNKTMLENAIAINEINQQYTLFELAETSVSNPVNRRNELMTRISGFEKLADEFDHVAWFATLTAPSCYHAQLHDGGENKLYEAAGQPTVRAAQQWLCKMWARARAKLKRLSVQLYGFRIAEPHHDGTPHWHAIFFVPRHQSETLVQVIKGIWLSEHADEKGAQKYRCEFKPINKHIGSAAGYVAKYVAKNIDGFQVGPDFEAGGDADSTAHRVDAWASTHRIRQFQQVGGAGVGIWRECRRAGKGIDVAGIKEAVMCADDGDWAGFCKTAQGIELWKETTGECNQYREVKAPSVIGVQCGAEQVRTRIHEWSVQWGGGHVKKGSEVGCVHNLFEPVIHGVKDRVFEVSGLRDAGARKAIHDSSGLSSASEARSLGPVSITVRSGPRGDGLNIYQHAGRWHVYRMISISNTGPPPFPRGHVLFTYERRPFCEVRHASTAVRN